MTTSKVIRVILIDDNRLFHDAVVTVLTTVQDIALVGRGSTGSDAVRFCEELQPDLILMDVKMPGMTGVEATRIIHHSHPDIKILVLSSYQDDESVREMLMSGAAGYILKGLLASDLVNTIRTVYAGKAVFSTEVTHVLLQPTKDEPALDFGLTRRELEVLRGMAEGLSHKEIAAKLTISQSTVKFHIVNILKKMTVETRSEAMVLAAKHKLI